MSNGEDVHPILALTRKEKEVARLVAEGFSNKLIAESLGVNKRTVETHIYRAISKLGVKNRTQLILVLLGKLKPNSVITESRRTTLDKQNMRVLSLHKQGLRPKEIHRILEVPISRIYYVLKKLDLLVIWVLRGI